MSPAIHPGPPPLLGERVRADIVLSRPDARQPLIDAYATELLGRAWVVPEDEHWLRLCLEEALTNAMIHGNEADPALPVAISLWRDPERWTLLINDRGTGFSAQDLPAPENAAALQWEHGRGILLMREWLDELTYYDNGATALLARRLAARNP